MTTMIRQSCPTTGSNDRRSPEPATTAVGAEILQPPTPAAHGRCSNPSDHVAVETTWRAELSLLSTGSAFQARLVREDTTYFDDDPAPEFAEQVLCEQNFPTSLPAVFGAVDDWLFQGHKLRVLAHTWTPCASGPDAGVALLLEAQAVPVHPVTGPLGCWSA